MNEHEDLLGTGPSFDDVAAEIESGRLPSAAALPALSAQPKAESERIARATERLADEMRRSFFTRLADIAEDNPEYDFTSIFQPALDDPDTEVRLKAIDGLWECNDRWLMRRLLDILADDSSTEVRIFAATALGRFVVMGELGELRHDQVQSLRQSLMHVARNTDEPGTLRGAATESVGADSSDEVASLLQGQYGSGDRQARLGAIGGMGRSYDSRWLPILTAELDSTDDLTRFEAVTAVGQIGDPSAVTAVIPLLADSETEIRMAALAALGEIGGPVAMKAIGAFIDAVDDPAQKEAAEAALEDAKFEDQPFGFSLN